MYIILIELIFIGCIITSCNTNHKANIKEAKKDTVQFFPIIELLRADVDDVMKTPYFLYKTSQILNKKKQDSIVITRDDFLSFAKPLIDIKISKEKYKESFFEDLSTESISVITTSTDTSSTIKSITTLLNNKSNILKSMYFTENYFLGDTSVQKNIYWKAGKSVTIITTKSVGKKEITKKEFINWNDKVE